MYGFKNSCGYLSYIDVSIGKKVAGFSTNHGRCDIMVHNPSNAIINLAHTSGKHMHMHLFLFSFYYIVFSYSLYLLQIKA
jgi:hypothetical protein